VITRRCKLIGRKEKLFADFHLDDVAEQSGIILTNSGTIYYSYLYISTSSCSGFTCRWFGYLQGHFKKSIS
jgi:hypothetical protein